MQENSNESASDDRDTLCMLGEVALIVFSGKWLAPSRGRTAERDRSMLVVSGEGLRWYRLRVPVPVFGT
jgi:hypothetical protein